MKPSELLKALDLSWSTRRPLFIAGPPGIGKSAIPRDWAQAKGIGYLDCRLLYWDTVDLRGMPKVENGRTTWCPPAVWPDSGEGVIAFDELPAAAPAVQAASFQLWLDRQLAEYRLPDGWHIIGMGNRQSDRAGAGRLLSPLLSRMIYVELECSLDDWSLWAISSGIAGEVVQFLRFRPELLFNFDPAKWDGRSYACPRAWEFVSDLVKTDPTVSPEILTGTVGAGAATEFYSFLSLYRSLPSIDSILLSPQTSPVPEELSARWAVSGALARRATAGNIGRVMQYVSRLSKELEVLTIKDAALLTPAVGQTPEFVTWSVKNQGVLS